MLFRRRAASVRPDGVSPTQIAESLAALFRENGVDGSLGDEWVQRLTEGRGRTGAESDPSIRGVWIAFAGTEHMVTAAIVGVDRVATGVSVRLEVYFQVRERRVIVESFIEIAPSAEFAVAKALRTFAECVLPVLLAVFFDTGTDRIVREEWVIGHSGRRVVITTTLASGTASREGAPWRESVTTLQQALDGRSLNPDLHWIRLNVNAGSSNNACEVLLDNTPWSAASAQIAALRWPAKGETYRHRLFLIIHASANS